MEFCRDLKEFIDIRNDLMFLNLIYSFCLVCMGGVEKEDIFILYFGKVFFSVVSLDLY